MYNERKKKQKRNGSWDNSVWCFGLVKYPAQPLETKTSADSSDVWYFEYFDPEFVDLGVWVCIYVQSSISPYFFSSKYCETFCAVNFKMCEFYDNQKKKIGFNQRRKGNAQRTQFY